MTLFYDGHCAMCNRAVTFVLRRDTLARFSPLNGNLALKLPQKTPDSMVVETDEGSLLMRSEAWVYILRRLPAPWRTMGSLLALIPRPFRDAGYDVIALCRRPFRSSSDVCPIIPEQFRGRFKP